jgi:hypothetical protein
VPGQDRDGAAATGETEARSVFDRRKKKTIEKLSVWESTEVRRADPVCSQPDGKVMVQAEPYDTESGEICVRHKWLRWRPAGYRTLLYARNEAQGARELYAKSDPLFRHPKSSNKEPEKQKKSNPRARWQPRPSWRMAGSTLLGG